MMMIYSHEPTDYSEKKTTTA